MPTSAMPTDFHAHILPGADHGSDGIETSVAQLGFLAEAGIKRVVATPHFNPQSDCVESFLVRRNKCAAKLKESLNKSYPSVYLGAEVLVCAGINNMRGLDKLCITGTDIILLEMPAMHWNDPLLETVEAIIEMGLTPVMAHIDRYQMHQVQKLLLLQVKTQINTESYFKRNHRKRIFDWIDDGRVDALGTDLHGSDKKCVKNFIKTCQGLGDKAENIFQKTTSLLSGAIEYIPHLT